jgi:S-adenosylmethionine hydrolase
VASIITLLTDFGSTGPYVAAVKGAILSVNPKVTLLDVSHDVRPHDVREAAYLLWSVYRYFPPGTVHLVVVDPGVGSRRRAIALEAKGSFFVGPDNGVFSLLYQDFDRGRSAPGKVFSLARRPLPPEVRGVVLTEPGFWRHPLSSTFHGRDLFGPVAAHLSLGTPLKALGRPLLKATAYRIPSPHRLKGGAVGGEVVYKDRFGNLITNIARSHLPTGSVEIRVGGKVIQGLSNSYLEETGLVAVVSSNDTVEIAVPRGSAAEALKAEVGMKVVVQAQARRRAR